MPKELSQKADLALADLSSNGGLLDAEQNDRFIQNLTDTDTIMRLIRTVPMNSSSQKINKIGFGSNIMKPASQNSAASTALHAGRRLTEAHRSKPTTSQVVMNTSEVMAEVRFGYEVLEDNIEKGNLENTLLAMISNKMAEELEKLLIQGDAGATGGVDPWLDLFDGLLELSTARIYDAGGAPASASVFNTAMKLLPTKYRANKNAMRWMSSMDTESDYRLAVASRGTGLGDAVLTGNAPLPVLGVPMIGAAFMPNSKMLFTNPQNCIFGVQRNIRLETDRDISAREVLIVVTMRIAVAIEETDAVVKVINLGAA
jgi:HK97 family phage major capsid protein